MSKQNSMKILLIAKGISSEKISRFSDIVQIQGENKIGGRDKWKYE